MNQSSTAAWLYANYYGLAKKWVNGPDQQLSRELGWQNIRINAIAPIPIDAEANRTTTPAAMVDDIVKRIPLSRMEPADDLVGMCLFLLSDQAKWITGQIFNVDGGQIIRPDADDDAERSDEGGVANGLDADEDAERSDEEEVANGTDRHHQRSPSKAAMKRSRASASSVGQHGRPGGPCVW